MIHDDRPYSPPYQNTPAIARTNAKVRLLLAIDRLKYSLVMAEADIDRIRAEVAAS